MALRSAAEQFGQATEQAMVWRKIARPKQLPPPGDWLVWMVMAGRGFGKTRTGAEFIDEKARTMRPGEQLLIAGRTPSDVRDYSLYGEGGLLRHHPDIRYEPSKRMLTWPNGVVGLVRSGANPEEFRGASVPAAWLDEFAAWDYPQDCWDNLIFGTREGNPQILITTTPRPIRTLREIVKMDGVVVVSGSSYENRENLSEKWVRQVLDPRAGTRLGRQEIDGQILDDVAGALWRLDAIDAARRHRDQVPDLASIVVAIDPQGTKASDEEPRMVGNVQTFSHETGIVVAGLGTDDHVYVLEDATINGKPSEWGTRAVAVYDRHKANSIVAEKNFGGDMVEHTVRTVRKEVPFEMVNASRGKIRRAEPVSALYDQGRVHHVGTFAALEDEMCSYTGSARESSPNRLDALVWAITKLVLGEVEEPPMKRATWGRRSPR